MRAAFGIAMAGCLLLAVPAAAQERRTCAGADRPGVEAVLCIVNAERAARGLAPVAREPRLDAASARHSADMARRGYFDHVSPEGQGPDGRATDAGYPFGALYENIAIGSVTAREVMTGWMRSTGHCRGVLAPGVTDMGIAMSHGGSGGALWTQMFGRTQDRPAPSTDTLPADGCPYERLSIAPGPAPVAILALGRRGNRVTVRGRLADHGGGRRIVVAARRGRRVTRRRVLTRPSGEFRARLRVARGRGRIVVTVTAPAVRDLYARGRDRRTI